MNVKKALLAASLLSVYDFQAQQTEAKIDTVYIFDHQLKKQKDFVFLTKLKPEDVERNNTNLSDVLRFQSSVYIKENGKGAVSSPAFRGTTAQQTAFVWNGININSQFLGQGDINNIGFLNADEITIKPGGGSVIYGSGAIGGTVHLDNQLWFDKGFQATLYSSAGSFDTYTNLLKTSYSNKKLSAQFSSNYSISQNDFKVGQKYQSRNGKYFNTDFNFGLGYKVAPFHQLAWITEHYNGTQHYPIFDESQLRTQYQSTTFKSLVSWDFVKQHVENHLKLAYTEDQFGYFEEINQPKSSGGLGKNYIIKNDFNYIFNPKWNVNFLVEFQKNKGEGFQSGITDISRNLISTAALLRYAPQKNVNLEAGIKKDFVEDISSPLLFSFSGKWKWSKHYQMGINLSKNFRYPSFNDLYWQPGGNLSLKSETSQQIELNNSIDLDSFKILVTPYFIDIKNMIRWLPSQYGYWAPFNTDHVKSMGIETKLSFLKTWGNHQLQSVIGYSYTQSTDQESKKQLMYVPLHKASGSIDYRYRFFKVFVQGLYNGLTYTTSNEDNKTSIKPYFVLNSGADLQLFTKYTIGFQINNILNEQYQTVAYYYMPPTNYNIHFKIKF